MRRKLMVALAAMVLLGIGLDAAPASARAVQPGAHAQLAQSGYWHYSDLYASRQVCEVLRTAKSARYHTEGCFLDPNGWVFWWYVP